MPPNTALLSGEKAEEDIARRLALCPESAVRVEWDITHYIDALMKAWSRGDLVYKISNVFVTRSLRGGRKRVLPLQQPGKSEIIPARINGQPDLCETSSTPNPSITGSYKSYSSSLAERNTPPQKPMTLQHRYSRDHSNSPAPPEGVHTQIHLTSPGEPQL
jgi:hypothetical protein